ncbi:pecanex-like protein 4 [Mytilus galloprovincialis]|uniref:pecanex-like protein 4 n=1 Tax=Mytilus galloprovincialis TaxID=29158 RepID=UPI003F7C524D
MGTGIPLLNEYKREFLSKRFPQTLLGGPKLRLGYEAPVYVYFQQLLLFLFPFLIGGIFTLLVELKTIDDYVGSVITGSLIFTCVLIVQLTSTIVQAQNSSDLPYPTKKNLLAEEDEIDFFSCCGVETLEFVVPKKRFKFNIVIHAVLSGFVCGLTFMYLLPMTLNSLYSHNTGATVVLYIFGWLTLCIAQYSLSVGSPPEPNTYKTQDSWEIAPLMRSLYVVICVSIYLMNRYYSTVFNTADQTLHIVFACLPLAWITGLLPPLDAFILWLFEQIHVFMLGGSPVSSDIRLLVLLVISLTVFLAAYFIKKSIATVVICALMGYLLSLDLGAAANNIYHYLLFRNKVTSGTSSMDVTSQTSKYGFLWKFGLLQCLYHFVMIVIVGVMSGMLNSNTGTTGSIDSNAWKTIGYVIIGCCVAEKIFRDLQNVYIFFGLWRNLPCIYPNSRGRSYDKRRWRLRILGVIRRFIVNWVSPFLMLAYISILITSTDPDSVSLTSGMDTTIAVWYTFGTVRVFRWIWQGTVSSLLELSIVHIILVAIPNNTTVISYGVPILSLLIGLSRDRFFQFINKLYFVFTLLITSVSDKKQRRKSTIPIFVLSILFFPVVLGIIGAATVLSAPLLSLFTLPLFFIGFPRPNKFWPEAVGASANSNPDTMFYMQVAPKLSQTLRAAFADGSLGEPVPGFHYLVRFQDRLVWVMVLERGYGFCSLNIKGLELQETSCHTAEAARIDEIFESAFEKEDASCIGYINEYPMHTLTPMDSANVEAYSDARNVLTGIIDYPANYDIVMDSFIKALVWVLIRHVNQIKLKEGKKKGDESLTKAKQKPVEKVELTEFKKESNNNFSNGLNGNLRHSNNVTNTENTRKGNFPPVHKTTVEVVIDKDNRTTVRPPSSRSVKRKSSWSSLNSFTDSIFSEDGIFNDKKPPKKEIKKPIVSNKPMKSDDDIDVLDEMLDDLDFGLPAMDINQRSKPVNNTSKAPIKKNQFSYGNTIYKPVTNLAGSPDFKCSHSTQISLPSRWRELPLEYSQLSRYLSKFPRDWYKHVLGTLDWSNTGLSTQQVLGEVTGDEALLNCYSQLIMACYSIFESNGSVKSASQLYKYYNGDLPWNAMLDWLSEDKQLHNLVLRAYRYGFKLMLDQILIGEANTPEETQEYFEEYDKDWYIGLEKDDDWKAAVLSSRKQLFSMGHNKAQGTYNSRVLSLQPVMAHIGRMNPEVVKGQWANLSLELLYLTNDDEERYSIQAHPTILRNLTVQSADPPLGYPIFSSEPISIPTL